MEQLKQLPLVRREALKSHPHHLTFSPDGQWLSVATGPEGDNRRVGGNGMVVRTYGPNRDSSLLTARFEWEQVNALQWEPQGRRLLVGTSGGAYLGSPLRSGLGDCLELVGPGRGGHSSVDWSPRGERFLVYTGEDVLLVAAGDGRQLTRLRDELPRGYESEQYRKSVRGARFLRDGLVLLLTGISGPAMLWRPGSGQPLQRFAEAEENFRFEYCVSSSSTGRLVVGSRDFSFRLYRYDGQSPIPGFDGPPALVAEQRLSRGHYQLDLTRDGRLIAGVNWIDGRHHLEVVAVTDDTLRSVAGSELTFTPSAVAFTADGQRVAVVGDNFRVNPGESERWLEIYDTSGLALETAGPAATRRSVSPGPDPVTTARLAGDQDALGRLAAAAAELAAASATTQAAAIGSLNDRMTTLQNATVEQLQAALEQRQTEQAELERWQCGVEGELDDLHGTLAQVEQATLGR